MTTGAYGSQTTFSMTYAMKTDPYGAVVDVPCGWRRSRNWNGGDSSRPHYYSVITVPAKTQIVVRRRRDGSEYSKEVVIRRSRVVRKKIYTTGFWPPNDYDCDLRGASTSVGRLYYGHYPCQPSGMWRFLGGAYVPTLPSEASMFTANDDIKLVSKVGKRIDDSDFNPAVFLATSKQSLDTILSRTKMIAKSIAYLRKGDVSKAFHSIYGYYPTSKRTREINGRKIVVPRGVQRDSPPVSRAVAQTVLEIQYGWRPLIDDVYEGAVWLAAKLQKPMVHRVSTRLQRVGFANLRPDVLYSYRNQQTLVRKQIVAYFSEGKADTSLNVMNPAEVAWELLPWSFVVDWFIPIGDYLHARGVASDVSGTFVTTTKTQYKFWGRNVNMGSYASCTEVTNIWDFLGIEEAWSQTLIKRRVSSSLNVPTPVMKPLGKVASWEHCVNALALLTQVMHRKPDESLRDLGRLRN